MSRTTSPTSTENQNAGEEFVWPEFAPSPGHRNFIERLRRARIDCGLSIPDMAKRVGLGLRLAREFENAITPLPFCHLEIWCQVVGVPFEDYLALYWAEMEVYFEAEEREAEEREAAQEREVQEREVAQKAEREAPCITNTESGETEAPAPALSCSPRGFGFSNLLRAVAAHIVRIFLSLFSTSKETPK